MDQPTIGDDGHTSGQNPSRIVLPRHLYVEPADMEKYLNHDPLVGTRGAAIILGVSSDLLNRWRQRCKGPDYYQYEEAGPVLYSVRTLNAFKAANLVIPRKKRTELMSFSSGHSQIDLRVIRLARFHRAGAL